jgi:hypothetical protein
VNPSGNDSVTIPCPVCATPFIPAGKRRYCRDACRVAAHRRRTRTGPELVPLPAPPRPRRPVTVYECDTCGARLLGSQRCDECGTFMRRIGVGGHCPCCDEPVSVEELLNP